LKEEMTRILKANNPNAPQNIVRFSYKDNAYKLIPHVEQLAIHFQMDGNLIPKDSDEAKRQAADNANANAGDIGRRESVAVSDAGTVTTQAGDGGDDGDSTSASKSSSGKKLTNQFNFSERASQSYNNPTRDRASMTEPPPRAVFSSNATQWEIFDAYAEDFEEQQKNKTEDKKKTFKANDGKKSKKTNNNQV
jgi:dynein intermediate chain 1, axonemal